MRRPLRRISVELMPRPRSETAEAPAAKPAPKDEEIEPLLSIGRERITSAIVCRPDFSMSSREITCTGAEVSASVRVMREPLISIRSVVCAMTPADIERSDTAANALPTITAIFFCLSAMNHPLIFGESQPGPATGCPHFLLADPIPMSESRENLTSLLTVCNAWETISGPNEPTGCAGVVNSQQWAERPRRASGLFPVHLFEPKTGGLMPRLKHLQARQLEAALGR